VAVPKGTVVSEIPELKNAHVIQVSEAQKKRIAGTTAVHLETFLQQSREQSDPHHYFITVVEAMRRKGCFKTTFSLRTMEQVDDPPKFVNDVLELRKDSDPKRILERGLLAIALRESKVTHVHDSELLARWLADELWSKRAS
jgi:hypothetical protein